MNRVALSLSGAQAHKIRTHLFPGDGKEAAAIALCGVGRYADRAKLLVHDVQPVPYEICTERTEGRLCWPTAWLDPLLDQADLRGWSIVKFHSHPGGYDKFSNADDVSDRDLFHGIHSWLDTDGSHASVVMLPTGQMFGRTVSVDGAFDPLACIAVAGDDIRYWSADALPIAKGMAGVGRQAGTFGRQMVATLRELSAGIVGCSGTGSIVIEQLARLGFGRIVLVDPDFVETKNLNRIANAWASDASGRRAKVHVARDAIERLGFGTIVETIAKNVVSVEAVHALGSCDVLFGCVDGAEGRDVMNRVASCYLLPYVDMGVGLVADAAGEIDQIDAAVHYIQPGGSSLLSRGAYRAEQVVAEARRRADPAAYAALRKEGYIKGVDEQQPAVMPINMAAASFAVLEFLARLYGYRNLTNDVFGTVRLNLAELEIEAIPEDGVCPVMARLVGLGDGDPLLQLPELSVRR